MVQRVLVIGGTGPTGVPLVRGLVERGHDVTILHRGTHESDATPAEVRHVHLDPYDEDALRAAAGAATYDTVIAMYGRLRRIAEAWAGRTGRFLSVGGVPAYRGWMNPRLAGPGGLPVPVAEDSPLVGEPGEDAKGYRIVRTERAVFAHHPAATHVRYPYVYGPHQLAPREWCVVRRVLDGRRRIVVADQGLTLHHHGYTENLAHALLLAVDRPEDSAGRIYNAADDTVLTIRQVIDVVAAALGHTFEVVSLPYELAVPARPLLMQPAPEHRVLDLSRIRADLGYRDLVPAHEALARTARWLVEHPPRPGGAEETILTDPFDYAAEDRLMDAWAKVRTRLTDGEGEFAALPGYGLAYSGPGGRPRSTSGFAE
ncbi:NAD-dependent epimerase/dehydratase family protein [Streptomyces sp. SID3343]|uniref:NAD-dependent epimerase/dehydratase family protein n=1 Tax=Streptomyces sp. SID3343 TaxID=2690260 RepID=UPI0013719028|nr:NAD-dependent epimerase/dehydratase family protein [Streptomyces sp. SID3343]MYW02005.1 NAD-dependent epimerase/dehydratase family protein [Streptomyces sp. SID3343]